MKVALIYWRKEGKSGTERYALSLIKKMREHSPEYGIEIEEIEIRKVERSMLGKPIGGNVSLLMKSMSIRPKAPIVHSLSPEVVCPNTNLVTVHDVFPLKYPEIYSPTPLRRRSNEKVFKRIARIPHIISVSKSTKLDLEKILGIEGERIRVIYEGVDFLKFFPDTSKPYGISEGKSLLLVGDLNPRKKYEVVFEASEELEEWKIYHVGPRNSWEARWRYLEGLASKSKGRIRLIGAVEDEELRRWLSNVDFFVFPSMDEGFGLPALEAMACGTNVLLSDIPIFREICGEMASGYFDLSPDSFVKALKNARPRRKEELIRYARKFSWEEAAKKTLEYYLEISRFVSC